MDELDPRRGGDGVGGGGLAGLGEPRADGGFPAVQRPREPIREPSSSVGRVITKLHEPTEAMAALCPG